MHSPKHRPPLFLIALVVLAGCQLTEIYDLGPGCKEFKHIKDSEDDIICKRGESIQCFKNHKHEDGLDQSDFESAFSFERCPQGYSCVTTINDGKYCIHGTCKVGDTKCLNGNIYKCLENNRWAHSQSCAKGCHEVRSPDIEEIECSECNDTDPQFCEGSTIKSCKNYMWISALKPCETGCSNGECNECKTGEKKCDTNKIYECKNGRWNELPPSTCEFGCTPNQHTYDGSSVCNECKDGDLRCANSTIQNCVNGKWQDQRICDLGCFSDQNNGEPKIRCKECKDGDVKYKNNEKFQCVKQICENGLYHDDENNINHNASCKSDLTGIGDCINGSPKCDNNTLMLCIDGTWKKFGHCDPNNPCELLNGKSCYDSIIGITCTQDTQDNKLIACPHNSSCAPQNNNYECAECQNGTTKCSEEGKLQLCQNGVFASEAACREGTHCAEKDGKAQCILNNCEIAHQQCNKNGQVQECKDYNWETIKDCDQGHECFEDSENHKADCGCRNIGDICESYEICQDGVCQRMSCTEDVSICKRCQEGECYDSNNALSFCNNSLVKDFWGANYGIIYRIIHIDDNDSCEVYESLKQVINNEGTNLCNKIKTCGNPNALEECMFHTVLNIMAGNIPNNFPSEYGGSLDIADAVRVSIFVNDDHSECNISKCETDDDCTKCETDNDCTKYQQCNTKGECVRKPCGRYPKDINICGDGYICVNDVCEEKCDIGSTRCQGNTLNTCAKGYWETEKCGAKGCKVEEGKAQCVEIDN